MINREAFERARRETEFVAEADYLSLDVVDAARDFVEDKISEYELNSAFARMEGKTKAIAGAAPARIRDRYLPRVESIFRSMDESIREIKKLKAEGKTDDALAVVDVDLADRSAALSRLKDEALVSTYEGMASRGSPYHAFPEPTHRLPEEERVREVAMWILDLLREKGPMTIEEISARLDVPPEHINKATDILMSEGKIEWDALTGRYSIKLIKHIIKHPPKAEAGILRCRFCGAPYLYRENLEAHERSCLGR